MSNLSSEQFDHPVSVDELIDTTFTPEERARIDAEKKRLYLQALPHFSTLNSISGSSYQLVGLQEKEQPDTEKFDIVHTEVISLPQKLAEERDGKIIELIGIISPKNAARPEALKKELKYHDRDSILVCIDAVAHDLAFLLTNFKIPSEYSEVERAELQNLISIFIRGRKTLIDNISKMFALKKTEILLTDLFSLEEWNSMLRSIEAYQVSEIPITKSEIKRFGIIRFLTGQTRPRRDQVITSLRKKIHTQFHDAYDELAKRKNDDEAKNPYDKFYFHTLSGIIQSSQINDFGRNIFETVIHKNEEINKIHTLFAEILHFEPELFLSEHTSDHQPDLSAASNRLSETVEVSEAPPQVSTLQSA